MANGKKLRAPVTLFAKIETVQHEALRKLAFEQRRPIADLVREALDQYVRAQQRGARSRSA